MPRTSTTAVATVAAFAALGLAATPASAAPQKGTTTIAPSETTLSVLDAVLRPATLTADGAVFRIVGNPCDGTVEHVGGLLLEAATGPLEIRNPTIDLTAGTVSLIVNDGARADLFTLGEGAELLFTEAASQAVVGSDAITGTSAGVAAVDLQRAC